jgi:hypothetical protein
VASTRLRGGVPAASRPRVSSPACRIALARAGQHDDTSWQASRARERAAAAAEELPRVLVIPVAGGLYALSCRSRRITVHGGA